jgi:hypothetical protein
MITGMRRPLVIVWILLMTPSFMWFVIGGSPQTAGLQRAMTAPAAWKAVLVASVAAQVWLAWQVVLGVRSWPKARRLPIGDDAAMLGLRIACGVGAVGFGGYALMRGFSGLSPRQSLFAHVVEAAASATSATSLQIANAAAAAVPPEGEELGRPLERQGSWLFDSATGEYAWVPPDAIGWAAGHVLDHAAGEAVAHVLDIVKTGAGGIAGAALGLETDNPGAVPKENVVYMPEQTVTGTSPEGEGPPRGRALDYQGRGWYRDPVTAEDMWDPWWFLR